MMRTRRGGRPAAVWAAAAILLVAGRALAAPSVVPLAGSWRCELDPGGVGETQRWFARTLVKSIKLPGSIDESGLAPANPAKPNMDGLYRTHPYVGAAWYERSVRVPDAWRGRNVRLYIERTHWVTRAWVDGNPVGEALDSLVAPHVHELGVLTPGEHVLTVLQDNRSRFDMGPFVSVLYEGTQTNWNGLIGRIELQAVEPVAVEDVQVYPDVERKLAVVHATVAGRPGQRAAGTVVVTVRDRRTGAQAGRAALPFSVTGGEALVTVEVPVRSPRLWDEFSPALYDATVAIQGTDAAQTVTFGMRRLEARRTQFAMNGRTLLLRGTLECGIFPRTGYPPTDVASWQRIYRVIKSYGLNFLRFHSWCPPDAAFAAADVEGVMLQVEGPQANVNAGEAGRDAFVEQEFLRMVRTYGNHPSFCLMTLGNEYGGPDATLSRWIEMLKREDPRHIYSSPSAGQTTANRQYTEGGPRGINGPGTMADFRAAVEREGRPLMGHEIGQWTFFPNFAEIPKYNGVLAARNFELVRDALTARHMADLAPRFFDATGRHAVLLYKEEIEVLRRTPGYAGFSLLDLHDYPGQGTALVGPLDPFWESKGFVSGPEHSRYCGPTAPLLRMPKRVYTTDEPFSAEAEVSHFGPADLSPLRPAWAIRDSRGRTIASGELVARAVPAGQLTPLGSIHASLSRAAAPCKLTVTVSLPGTPFSNAWDIWVYPKRAEPAPPSGVTVARSWDESAKAALAQGKAVVLFARGLSNSGSLPGSFLPVFWSPIWFPSQRPNTMGILCDPAHPALGEFPTDAYTDWQWYDLLQHSRAVVLDDAPPSYRPIVQVVDNFARNHRLGNLFEARVGAGRLLVCSIDLPALAPASPVARQLMASLYAYAVSGRCAPSVELDGALLDRLLAPNAAADAMQRLGARIVEADSAADGYPAANAIDGDPTTIWHTPWGEGATPLPHHVTIAFAKPVRLAGVVCLPRQDMHNGVIKDYRIEVSGDGQAWRVAATGRLDGSSDEQTVRFTAPQTAQYVRFTALSSYEATGPFIALAELSVMEAK